MKTGYIFDKIKTEISYLSYSRVTYLSRSLYRFIETISFFFPLERIVDNAGHDKPLTSSWPNELKLQEIENDKDDSKFSEDDLDDDEDYDDDEYYEDDDEFDDDYDDEEEDDLDDDYDEDEEEKVYMVAKRLMICSFKYNQGCVVSKFV